LESRHTCIKTASRCKLIGIGIVYTHCMCMHWSESLRCHLCPVFALRLHTTRIAWLV